MSIDTTAEENELFYQPEEGYWEGQDKLGFESQHMLPEWPTPTNPFVRRMAQMNTADRGLHNIGLLDFQQVIGALIEQDHQAVYRFLVIPVSPDASKISVTLLQIHASTLPPLRADNIGSLSLAFAWMAKRNSSFEVSCAADGNYWIHSK